MANTEPFTRSGPDNPCPVCTRDHDSDCSFNKNTASCHKNTGHKAGYEQNGWVYRKDSSDGRCGVFSRPRARRPRDPATTYRYSDTQRTARFVFKDGSKKVLPQHWDGSKWITKAGPNEWGAYREEQVTGQKEIYEFEGEKCAEMAASDGLAAISHPGFAHKVQQIVQRYRRLKAAGAELIVVIADNDETGPKRAAQSADAAYTVGLTCLVLNAQDIWDNMPKGGSIDDAPGQGAERIAPLLVMVEKLKAAGPLVPVEVVPEDDRPGIPWEPERIGNPAFYAERSKLLLEVLGPYWRADEEKDNAWWQWTGDRWIQVNSNDPIKRALVSQYNQWD